MGHDKSGSCIAALWLQVYLTLLEWKRVDVSQVCRVMITWPTNVRTVIPSITSENVYQAIESFYCSQASVQPQQVVHSCSRLCNCPYAGGCKSPDLHICEHLTSQPRIWLSSMSNSNNDVDAEPPPPVEPEAQASNTLEISQYPGQTRKPPDRLTY